MSIYDGTLRYWWVPTISDEAAPTVAEIGAGTELTAYTPKDGYRPGAGDTRVDEGALDTEFDAKAIGTFNNDGFELMLFRDKPDAAAFTLFKNGAVGYVVALPLKGTGSVAADDVAEVYPAEAGRWRPQNSASNTKQKGAVTIGVTDTPDIDAVVAA